MKITKAALKALRSRSHEGQVFSIEFLTHNKTKAECNGVKKVERCVLRSGYNQSQSDSSEVLVAYKDLDSGKPGFFYAPLLLKVNNQLVCNMKL